MFHTNIDIKSCYYDTLTRIALSNKIALTPSLLYYEPPYLEKTPNNRSLEKEAQNEVHEFSPLPLLYFIYLFSKRTAREIQS